MMYLIQYFRALFSAQRIRMQAFKCFRISVSSLCTVLLLCALPWTSPKALAASPDLTTLPLEELLETEVISATHFAQQIVDAPSAVSIITADEIHRFGYRTIAEILDNMRGLHVTRGLDYSYLGGRGYGAPGDYAGRILVLIDGYPAADNFFSQIYIADDGYLDTALIERVEYAPGPGSAIYGNSAFLGVINIVTRKGRNFDGVEAEVVTTSNQDQEARITGGNRFDNGLELLFSASVFTSDGRSQEYDGGDVISSSDRQSERFFLKGGYRNWSLEAASSILYQDNLNTITDFARQSSDRNRFIHLEHDAYIGRDWRTVTRLYYGDFQFEGLVDDQRFDVRQDIETNGSWYGIDSKLIYLGLDGHQILLGSEYRIDQEQETQGQYRTIPDDEVLDTYKFADNGNTFSLYGEDRITLSPTLSASLGGRYDRRHFDRYDTTQDVFNPRFAVIHRPTEQLSLKLSYGQASRFITPEEYLGSEKIEQPSRVRTTEFVAEHKTYQRRLLASLYRYHVDQLPTYTREESNTIRGAELESEWQWQGAKTLRLSYAWQHAENNKGADLTNVPNHIGKLHFSTPILNERTHASLALRYVGERKNLTDGSVDSYTVADVTLASEPLSGMDVSVGIRNLFDEQYDHVSYDGNQDGLLAQDGRSIWLRVGYRFQ